MKGKFQGQDEIIINAPKEQVWNVLIDGSKLSQWMPIVKHTTSTKECLNAVRSCEVDFEGKNGNVKERCVLFDEHREIGWEMEYDNLGFSKMFNNYGFSFELIPKGENKTMLINKGFYDPKNFLVYLINLVLMKRKSSSIRKSALSGLKRVAED